MGIFHPGEVVTPDDLVLGNKALETGLELLVEVFGLTIGLRVVAGGHADSCTEELAMLLPKT